MHEELPGRPPNIYHRHAREEQARGKPELTLHISGHAMPEQVAKLSFLGFGGASVINCCYAASRHTDE